MSYYMEGHSLLFVRVLHGAKEAYRCKCPRSKPHQPMGYDYWDDNYSRDYDSEEEYWGIDKHTEVDMNISAISSVVSKRCLKCQMDENPTIVQTCTRLYVQGEPLVHGPQRAVYFLVDSVRECPFEEIGQAFEDDFDSWDTTRQVILEPTQDPADLEHMYRDALLKIDDRMPRVGDPNDADKNPWSYKHPRKDYINQFERMARAIMHGKGQRKPDATENPHVKAKNKSVEPKPASKKRK